MEQEKRLHILRIRARGDDAFYDPQADFRGILPNVMQMALDDLKVADRGEDPDTYLYLEKCLGIFRLRLLEDPTPLTEQVALFKEALTRAPRSVRSEWLNGIITILLLFYALMMRRDQPMDSARKFRDMVDAVRLLDLKGRLTAEHYKQLCEWLNADTDVDRTPPVSDASDAVCEESGERFRHLRDIAARLVNATGSESWEDMSNLCDEQFCAEGQSDMENIALALAYPSYNHPTLGVKVEAEDHDDR